MKTIKDFALAIQKLEGYKPGSLGWRNNNPGNLRWSPFQAGQSGGFSYFNSYEQGFKALMWDIEQKCRGNTRSGLGPKSTLYQFACIWAPASDNNNPLKYSQDLASILGLTSNSTLDTFIKEIEPVQRILVVLNNFGDKRMDVIRQAFQSLQLWFNDLGISTSVDFIIRDTPMIPIITINGAGGLDYTVMPINVLDPVEVNKIVSPHIADHHFVVFAYHKDQPGTTPTEFHQFLLGSLVTQLPILDISNHEWIELFAKHELLHGWYMRAVNGGAGVQDDVHKQSDFSIIVNKLKPYVSLMFSRDFVPYVFKKEDQVGFQISWSRKLINLMKDLIYAISRK